MIISIPILICLFTSLFFIIFEYNDNILFSSEGSLRILTKYSHSQDESKFEEELDKYYHKFNECLIKNSNDSKICFIGKDKNKTKRSDLDEYFMDKPYTREQQLIHYPQEYSILIEPHKFCDLLPSILIAVHCGPNQYLYRYVIRKTWGSIKNYRGYTFKLAFFMGKDNDDIDEKLLYESNKYNDIIQFSHINTYLNNTITAMLCYKWVLESCPQIQYLIKSDIDMYVNIKTIIDNDIYNKSLYNTALGWIIEDGIVIREMRHKNSIFEEFYPLSTWKPYLSGCLFIYTFDVIEKVYKGGLTVKPIHYIDDAYFGQIAEAYNITLKSLQESIFVAPFNINKNWFEISAGVHKLGPEDIYNVWNYLNITY